jgi:tetratricopeptide (TPR) repeat protein
MPTQRRRQVASRTPKKTSPHARPKRPAAAGRQKPGKTAKPAKQAKPTRPTRAAKVVKPVKPAQPKKAPPLPARKAAARLPAGRAATRRAGAKSGAAQAVQPDSAASHELAVETFERGFQALQQRQFAKAAELLNAVINNFSDEKELQERARVYLVICERQASREAKPKSFEDRLNAATIMLNRGAFDEGVAILRKLEAEDPGNDYAQYLLCVACSAVGNVEQALAHLRRAIELSPENQFRAAQDPDLEALRQDPAFAAMADEAPRRRKLVLKKR